MAILHVIGNNKMQCAFFDVSGFLFSGDAKCFSGNRYNDNSMLKKIVKAGLTSAALLAGLSGVATAATLVYSSADLGEWSNDYENIDLNGLAVHSEVTLHFDLFIYDSWDGSTVNDVGPDYFGFSVDGNQNNWTFDNFDPFDETNTVVATETGNFNSINYWGERDRKFLDYHNGFSFAHNAGSLHLSFYGIGLQGFGDESWSVKNLTVTTDAVPEPASILLIGGGCFAVGLRRRH
jgi:hypothetical protein